MIIKNVHTHICSSKNILPSKYKYSTIKMLGEDLELVIISLQLESNPSYALCLWDLIKVGIRFNSTCQTSHVALMVVTTFKLCEWQSMQIAESEEYTFQIDYTVRSSYLQSSSFSFPFRSSSDRSIVILLSKNCI